MNQSVNCYYMYRHTAQDFIYPMSPIVSYILFIILCFCLLFSFSSVSKPYAEVSHLWALFLIFSSFNFFLFFSFTVSFLYMLCDHFVCFVSLSPFHTNYVIILTFPTLSHIFLIFSVLCLAVFSLPPFYIQINVIINYLLYCYSLKLFV